jgi:hypothetical protein
VAFYALFDPSNSSTCIVTLTASRSARSCLMIFLISTTSHTLCFRTVCTPDRFAAALNSSDRICHARKTATRCIRIVTVQVGCHVRIRAPYIDKEIKRRICGTPQILNGLAGYQDRNSPGTPGTDSCPYVMVQSGIGSLVSR